MKSAVSAPLSTFGVALPPPLAWSPADVMGAGTGRLAELVGAAFMASRIDGAKWVAFKGRDAGGRTDVNSSGAAGPGRTVTRVPKHAPYGRAASVGRAKRLLRPNSAFCDEREFNLRTFAHGKRALDTPNEELVGNVSALDVEPTALPLTARPSTYASDASFNPESSLAKGATQ